MKIRTKLIIFGLIAIVIILLNIIGVINQNRDINYTFKKTFLLTKSLNEIIQLGSLTNDFILKKNERSIWQWRKKYSDLNMVINEVTSDSMADNYKGKNLIKSILQTYKEIGKQYISLIKYPDSEEMINRYSSGLNIFTTRLVNLIYEYEQLILTEKKGHLDASGKLVISGVLLMFILFLALFVVFNLTISKPIKIIMNDLRIIGKGDLSHRIKSTRNDEIGELTQSFNNMMNDLQTLTTSVDKLNNEIKSRIEIEAEREIIQKKLEATNKDLEYFAYMVSHDLQEPLRKIRSFTELLEKHLNENIDEKGKKYIAYVVSSAERMRELIGDILNLSRLTTQNLNPKLTRIENVVENVIEKLSMRINESGAEVEFGELPELIVEEGQINILIVNLISNAIKFRRDENPKISIHSEEYTDYWIISIADNGIGMEKQYFDRIFKVFQRLHTRDQYPGTGIGLAMCKKIMDLHQGDIYLESETGKGTTFFLKFPRQPISTL